MRAAVVLLLLPALARGSPAAAVAAAAADARALGEHARRVRYLALYAVPEKDRAGFLRLLAGQVNGISREPDLVRPEVVGELARVNLDDYGWPAAVWELLQDPLFTVRLQKEVKGKAAKKMAGKKMFVTEKAIAPWAVPTKKDVADLIKLTQSAVPVVRADWFVWQTGQQADRGKAGYLDFLGIKDRDTFERLVGFDAKLAK